MHDLLNQVRVLVCAFCTKNHYHDKCPVVTDFSERKEIAKKNKLCFKCLLKGHKIQKCRRTRNCFLCKSRSHHTAICDKKIEDAAEESQSTVVTSERSVFLETVDGVVADNKEKKSVPAKILLDKCAQSTYIVERLVKKLNLTPLKPDRKVKINAFADQNGVQRVLQQYEFVVKNPKVGCNVYVKGLAVPFIAPRLSGQRYEWAVEKYPQLAALQLSNLNDDREIEILIGMDFYNRIVGDEKKRFGPSGELVAISSKLGWVLSGPCDIPDSATSSHALLVGYEEEESLSKQVAKFWDLDSLGIVENEKSVYDGFLDEVKFIESEKRYQIRLPFKEDHQMIGDQYQLSLKQLLQLKERFRKDSAFRDRYDDVMQKQIKEGIIERAELPAEPGKVSYLSHFAVIRDDRETTKLRVVYNGSAKTRSPSLNECLYKGENMNPLLFDILLRFRTYPVALSADIEAAYLQILVHPDDRDYMRLLYFDDVTAENPKVVKYRFTRVIFGASSSPFLLAGVIRNHAEKYKDEDPAFVEAVLRQLYADDFNGGAPNQRDGYELYKKLKSRFKEANFNFRKWRTNDQELQKYINVREGIDMLQQPDDEAKVRKVLGMIWGENDTIVIQISQYVKEAGKWRETKRSVLKLTAKVYDPVGFVAGYVIKLKIFFQELCLAGLSWDEKLEEKFVTKWKKILKEFEEAPDVVVPRLYSPCDVNDPIVKYEMVGFSDASKKAYGCIVYLRITQRSGNIKVTFVTSKSRVTPIKKNGQEKCTLPRCELLGSLCLSNLMVNVSSALAKEISLEALYCYGDSEIAIAWIRASSKEFKTFVQNRVVKTRKNVSKEKWYYCKTDENPADIITREDKDPTSTLLWNGPKFLHNEQEFQESQKIRKHEMTHPEFEAELRATTEVSLPVATGAVAAIGEIIDIKRYNDWLRLFRVTAYVQRFVNNLKAKIKKEPLVLTRYVEANEMKKAKLLWILENQRTLDEKRLSELQHSLNLKLDGEGVLRSYSRLKHAKIPFNMKAPVLLNREHRLAEILVYYFHLKVLHRGVKQTLTEMRSEYWVTRGRSFVKKLVHPCSLCKKLNSRPYSYPEHSDLPELRFDDRFPFSSTGMDYLGPLNCYSVYGEKDKVHKAYISLFTCASTRAVSLEVVHDCQAATFTDAFSRFVARRGCPNVVVSDNGPTFNADETKKFFSNHMVEWKPILESAPWWGGMYERLVASVKRCIKKVVGIRTLTYIELQTLAAEIELILNNRPIGADYDDDVEEVLTPNHLIVGRMLSTTGDQQIISSGDDGQSLTKRKRSLNMLLDHFWERWRREYITALREVQRVQKRGGETIREGDVVLVFEEKTPRHLWRMARVEELLASSDEKVRGAKLKIGRTGSTIKRPINKLYPFVQCEKHSEGESDIRSVFKVRKRVETDSTQRNDESAVTENVESSDINVRNNESVRNVENDLTSNVVPNRVRREAAIVGELRRKLGNC